MNKVESTCILCISRILGKITTEIKLQRVKIYLPANSANTHNKKKITEIQIVYIVFDIILKIFTCTLEIDSVGFL